MSNYLECASSPAQSDPSDIIPPERIQALIHSVTVRITQQVAQINLQIGETPPPVSYTHLTLPTTSRV